MLSKLAITGPYILAGHSIAGFTTLYYANKYPAEVSAVIGIDPSGPRSMRLRRGSCGTCRSAAVGQFLGTPALHHRPGPLGRGVGPGGPGGQ